MHVPVVIVGGGLAGLTCAYHLHTPYRLLERDPRVGGLARSEHHHGFTFDRTGHWLHLRDERIRTWVEDLLGDELVRVERRATVYSQGVETPYPFQANTYGRPSSLVADCVLGYFRARERAQASAGEPAAHFEAFIRARMGDGFADHFMIPYNTKLWGVPPRELASSWCERFVPLPSPQDVVDGALKPQGSGQRLGYNTHFLYPREGGIGRLPEAIARGLKIPPSTGVAMRSLCAKTKRLVTEAGESMTYDHLVTTLPLPALVDRTEDAPDPVRVARKKLRATSVTYWDLGLTSTVTPPRPGAHWTYYPDLDVPFYRVGSGSAAMPSLAPPGGKTWCVEISHRPDTHPPVGAEEILTAMRRVGLLTLDQEPDVVVQHTLDGAYVLMDHDYGEAREIVRAWYAQRGVSTIGRYGAWTYDSMEGAMRHGLDAADHLAREGVTAPGFTPG